ncbi:MAG TPA: hypothetical protein VNI78_10300 [Vicinamibacterales bacterium]|nr:hypothetical protein [Vicinamibacterales bacterium]
MTAVIRPAGVAALALACSVSLAAQWPAYHTPGVPRDASGKPVLDGPPPRTPEGKVDFSGVWQVAGGGRGRGGGAAQPQTPPDPNAIPNSTFSEVAGRGYPLPLRPWAAALKKERMADNMKDNPDVWCLPIGIMQYHNHPQPRQIVQTKYLTLIAYESNYGLRYIYTDGRPAPDNDPQPWWFGYSRGWWEGDDTLVVETTNFLGDERAGWLDVNGSPYTDALKLTERFRRPTFGTMQIDVTIDDPKAYTRPFTVRVNHRLLVDQDMIEFICNENERSTEHIEPPAWKKGAAPRQLGPDMPLRFPPQ